MKILDRVKARLRGRPLTIVMFGPASTTLPVAARTLMDNAAFRDAYLEASDFVEARRGWSLWNELENDQPPPGVTTAERNFVEETVFQMCAFRALQRKGTRFDAIAGMSLGDAAAGFASGALTFEETLHVMCETIRAVLGAGGGDLVVVEAPVTRAAEVMRDPAITIVFEWTYLAVWAMPNESARNAQRRLRASGIPYRRLGFDCLSHTDRIDVAGLVATFESVGEREPVHRLYSTLEGDVVPGPIARSRWGRVISQPANLEKMWQRMRADRYTDILYIGSVAADAVFFQSLPDEEKPTRFTKVESILPLKDEGTAPAARHRPDPAVGDIAAVFRSTQFARDPYPHYRRWLAEKPVHKLEGEDFFVVLGYDAALSVVKRPTVFSSSPFESLSPVLPGADAPLHTRVRRALSPYYTRESVQAQRAVIAEITAGAIRNLERRSTFDPITELAVNVPFAVSCSMLGLTPSGAAALAPIPPHEVTWPDVERAIVDQGIFPDIIRNSSLPQEDIMQLLPFFIGAGVLTVRDLLAFAIYTLLRRRDLIEKLAADPSLVPSFVDELLRFEPAIHGVPRRSTVDTEVAGTRIPAGSTLWVWLGAANRDPAHFDRPDEFIIGRDGERHIAFGAGPHFCIGSHLGRLEAEVVIEALLPYLPRLRATNVPHFVFTDLRGGYPVYPLMRAIESWQLAFTS